MADAEPEPPARRSNINDLIGALVRAYDPRVVMRVLLERYKDIIETFLKGLFGTSLAVVIRSLAVGIVNAIGFNLAGVTEGAE
jgi:predicted PurR-regulated permease PerM